MIDSPGTRYADCAGISIAYQVLGKSDLDLVFVPGGVSHVDIAWQERRYRRMLERLTSFARVTVFDKRGMGASDLVPRRPTLQERMEDIRAVMDAAEIENAPLFGRGCSDRRVGGSRRGAGLEHRQGSGRRLGARLRGPGHS